MRITAAADGSSLGNPGPTGWAWYVDDDCWAAGGWPQGTNNIGELHAVLDLLQQSAGRVDELLVLCDSRYVISSVTEWMPGWKRRGWRKGDGKPVQNLELMQALDAALAGRDVRFEWVKGHAGHPLNEAADRRANGAASACQRGSAPDAGPGWTLGSAPDAPEPLAAPAAQQAEALTLFDTLEGLEPDRPDEEHVVHLERSLLTDAVRSDPAAVAALLAPDWHEIDASGRRWDREGMLAEIAPLATSVELELLGVDRIDTSTILLVWRALGDRERSLRSSLWHRREGAWQQRFHQGTPER